MSVRLKPDTTGKCRVRLLAGRRVPSPESRGLRAPARRATVRALVARAAADHDRAARRARRRVLLVLNRRERRGLLRIRGPGAAWRVSSRFHVERQLLGRRDGYLFAIVHAGAELGFRRQELRRHPAEDVVDDRLREADVGIARHPGRLEADVAELVDEILERDAVLQRVTDRL